MPQSRVDQIRAKLQKAKAKLEAAALEYALIEQQLHDEMAREMGLMGKVAARGDRRILVHTVHFIGERPNRITGFKINRNGRLSGVEVTMHLDGEDIEFSDYAGDNGNGK